MKTTKEMIEVMEHFDKGGVVEYRTKDMNIYLKASEPVWAWHSTDYRIYKEKEYITIEKWLIYINGAYRVVETSNIESYTDKNIKVVKLLDSYEIQIEL